MFGIDRVIPDETGLSGYFDDKALVVFTPSLERDEGAYTVMLYAMPGDFSAVLLDRRGNPDSCFLFSFDHTSRERTGPLYGDGPTQLLRQIMQYSWIDIGSVQSLCVQDALPALEQILFGDVPVTPLPRAN